MPMPYGPEMMLKVMAWENAKGALNACVSASIAAEPLSSSDGKEQTKRWVEFSEKVDAFISEIEDHGLNY